MRRITRIFWFGLWGWCCLAAMLRAQAPPAPAGADDAYRFPISRSPANGAEPATREPAQVGEADRGENIQRADNGIAAGMPPRRAIAQVTQTAPQLPDEQGQVWREYNLTPYTLRVTNTNHPEQAIVDWILRETGYEVWHGEPFGILSANSRTLRVYHTPEMHAKVADVVDRFVNNEGESCAFSFRVVTVDNPNWRVRVHNLLHPVAVQSQGLQAWVLAKEDAAVVVSDLRRRSDYREHSSPQILVNNGQSATVAVTRPRSYIRDAHARPEAWPGFENETAQFDEGFSLELSPLLSVDGRNVDAVIKCNIDQLEKLIPVMLDVPSTIAPRQRTKIEVPQITHCRVHERFRWGTDQVLLIDLGVVPPPNLIEHNPLANLPLIGTPARSNLLVVVECKGKLLNSSTAAPAANGALREAKTYRGRY